MVSRLKDSLLLVGGPGSERADLREIFRSGYDILEAAEAEQARMMIKQNGACIAAVLADIPLTEPDRLQMLAEACRGNEGDEIPLILLVTPTGTGEREEMAFSMGATEVILRPYTPAVIQRRTKTVIDLHLHKRHLETLVDEQRQIIHNTNQVMLDALSAIIEHRNTESGNHVLRIRRFTEILLQEVARACPEYGLTENSIGNITSASTLHDIGKISIPDSVLNKPGPLTEEEFGIIRTHTTVGGQLVRNLSGMGDEVYLRYAYNIALCHHERWDGGGYPAGLRGDEIPICAQVVGVADAFDALTTQRVYKPALPYDKAINMIVNGECGAFSPRLLECFKRVRSQMVELAHRYADGYNPKDDRITMPLPGPEWKRHTLDSMQLSQVKYQALLHHLNDTILELDLDHDLYHVVYNPDPDLDAILPAQPLWKALEHLQESGLLHPEDADAAARMGTTLSEEFFKENLRRKTFRYRLYSLSRKDYQPYDLTLLRVNTGNEEQRIVIAIWHRVTESSVRQTDLPAAALHNAVALQGLMSTALRCRCDREQSIHAGAGDLMSLTGYSPVEIAEQFGGKLLELVYPADREAFLEAAEKLLLTGGRADAEYRLLRKKAQPLWVLDRRRVFMEEDGQEYVYHAIRDNTQLHETIDRLQAEARRHELLTSQSEGVIFDLDLEADTMECSSRWQELFGYAPAAKNFMRELPRTSHFHPDDLQKLLDWVGRLRDKQPCEPYQEVRIVNRDSKYLWCRIHARLQTDDAMQKPHIVGIIYDVDEFKRASLALREQNRRDPLTKLLNKDSAARQVTEQMQRLQEGDNAALLLLDLDNFKSINDTYGHLYGDAVLSRIGETLLTMFRASDIVGRMGGDEFMVLLKNVSDEVVEDRCRLLLEAFRKLLKEHAPDLDVSCSIGAALAPRHGVSYAEVFQRADEALYLAKRCGKNQHKIYSSQLQYDAMLDGGSHAVTRIDSDEQPGMADHSFVRFVFRRLYESSDLDDTINELLTYIGEQWGVSRVYIFENNHDNTACSNTFEWCNQGVSPEKENLQNVSYIHDIQGWPEVFNEHGVFYCTDIRKLEPRFRAILEPQGIKSMLQCAIMDGGVFRGYVGFDENTTNRLWTQDQITLLQFLSEVLALFLLKDRAKNALERQMKDLQSVLDHQDSWIYVVEPGTFRMKYLNRKAKELAPRARVGMTCHKAFMDNDAPCENCPVASLTSGGIGTSIVKNSKFCLTVSAQASSIAWNGKEAFLLSCRETEDKE